MPLRDFQCDRCGAKTEHYFPATQVSPAYPCAHCAGTMTVIPRSDEHLGVRTKRVRMRDGHR